MLLASKTKITFRLMVDVHGFLFKTIHSNDSRRLSIIPHSGTFSLNTS
jgi:hypothetical protein